MFNIIVVLMKSGFENIFINLLVNYLINYETSNLLKDVVTDWHNSKKS